MSHHHIIKEESTYYLTYNNSGILWYDFSPQGDHIDTGLPFIEKFSTKEELKARVEELGHTWRDPLLPEFISIEELREEGSFINSQGITIHIDDILE